MLLQYREISGKAARLRAAGIPCAYPSCGVVSNVAKMVQNKQSIAVRSLLYFFWEVRVWTGVKT